MTKIDYVEGGIYQDAHTPETCIIIIDKNDDKWIYTYELYFDKNECLTNQLINDVIEEESKYPFINYKKAIPGVFPFFIDGYLGTIRQELLKELKNDLKTSKSLGFV